MKQFSVPFLGLSIILATLLFSVTVIGADEKPGPDWLAHYEVAFGRSAQGVPTARIEAELLWSGNTGDRPSALEVDMADDGFPSGYGSFVRDFEAVAPKAATASGKASAAAEDSRAGGQSFAAELVSIPDGRYRLPVGDDGSTGLRYTVVMEHDPSGWGPGPDEAPYRFDGGAFWTGRALFVTAPGSRAEVRFRAAKGERVSVSFEPIPDRGGTYLVRDASRLRDSFLIVGRHSEARLSVGEAVVTLALGKELADFMPSLERSVLQFMKASSAIFGGAPPGRILVVGNLGAPPGSLHGGTFATDVSFLVDQPLSADNAGRWRPFLVHEIFHLWNGSAIRFDAGQQYWFSEGVTEYYGHLLPVRIGEETADRFLETVRSKAAAYLGAAGSMSLLAAGDEKFLHYALVYQGGSLAALVLDVKIRHASSNRASLDDVLKRLYEIALGGSDGMAPRRGDRNITLEEITRTVSEVAGRPMDDFFEKHIVGSEVLPLPESFALAGLTLRARIAELPDLDAIVSGFLPVPSITSTPAGLKVQRSGTKKILPGDIIISVAGEPVKTFDDLRWALRDARPAGPCDVTVLRDGREVDLAIVLGGNGNADVPRSRFASVKVELATDPDPLALAIRESLLRAGE